MSLSPLKPINEYQKILWKNEIKIEFNLLGVIHADGYPTEYETLDANIDNHSDS